ncbi:MAG: ribose 5-phosphate isomerase B [Bacteroidetes bacterium]|nr:MAG: ribose 5-phosphate isomerase B [Bacteroidota bacterium]
MTKVGSMLAMASDHGGFAMKEFIKQKLQEQDYEIKDFGTQSEDSVDYPDFIHPLAFEINNGNIEKGIIMCGSGNGAQMTANKYPNVRAALCWDKEQTMLTRQHNDANVLSLPGRFISFETAWEMVQVFLSTDFEGGRHIQRVEKIAQILK